MVRVLFDDRPGVTSHTGIARYARTTGRLVARGVGQHAVLIAPPAFASASAEAFELSAPEKGLGVVPSVYEPSGLVALEAMLAGAEGALREHYKLTSILVAPPRASRSGKRSSAQRRLVPSPTRRRRWRTFWTNSPARRGTARKRR